MRGTSFQNWLPRYQLSKLPQIKDSKRFLICVSVVIAGTGINENIFQNNKITVSQRKMSREIL